MPICNKGILVSMQRNLHIIAFGEPLAGIWCDTCALPSALRFYLVGQDGMSVIDFGTRDFCPECDHMVKFVDHTVTELSENPELLSNGMPRGYARNTELEDRMNQDEQYAECPQGYATCEPAVDDTERDAPWHAKNLTEKTGAIMAAVLMGLIIAFVFAELSIFGYSIVVHTWRHFG